jgi:hypothetical protein
MSVTEHPRPSKPAHGFTWGRAIRLGLFVVLCVAGYAAFQLVPGWLRFLAGRETAVLRRNVAILFVDTLLIAYPLTLLSALVGALVLVFLLIRARSRRRRAIRICRRPYCTRACFCSAVQPCLGSPSLRPVPLLGGRGSTEARTCRLSPRERSQKSGAMQGKIPDFPADSRARKRQRRAPASRCEFW